MENRAGLNLSFQAEGNTVRGPWVPRPEFAGYRNVIHGGLTATVLDEVMTWACAIAAGRFCYCAEMTVRYVRPVHPGESLTLHARLTANRRGRLFEASGELVDEAGAVRASAAGKYLAIPADTLADMAGDFVGDASPFLGGAPGTQAGSDKPCPHES